MNQLADYENHPSQSWSAQGTPITEPMHREFRAELFDITNHAQFIASGGNISDGADFGPVMQARDPRLVHSRLKISF